MEVQDNAKVYKSFYEPLPSGLPPPVLEDSEELHPPLEECEFGDNDIAFFIVRCLTLFFCLIGMILVLVNIIRGNRLKSWRLYFTTALSVFAWVALTLYQDKVDEFCVQELLRSPGSVMTDMKFLSEAGEIQLIFTSK